MKLLGLGWYIVDIMQFLNNYLSYMFHCHILMSNLFP